MVVQGQELKKNPHIVVATPGRLADHLESCDTFTLKKIKFLILDEADRLLGGLFDEQIKTIFQALPKKRQSLLFSATITDTLEKVKQVASNKVTPIQIHSPYFLIFKPRINYIYKFIFLLRSLFGNRKTIPELPQ